MKKWFLGVLVCLFVALLVFPVTWKSILFPGPKLYKIETPRSHLSFYEDETKLRVHYSSVSDESDSFIIETAIINAWNRGIRSLELVLDNGGGSGIVMFDLIDTLESYKAKGLKVTTWARGYIASAAVPLFLTGDVRITSPSTLFMIHPCGGWNSPMLVECERFLIAEITMRYCDYVGRKTRMGFMWCWEIMAPEDPEKNYRTNQYWFNAHEALMMGFATEVTGAQK